MNGRNAVVKLSLAVGMTAALLVAYFLVTMLMLASGWGAGSAFVRDMAADRSDAVQSGAAFVQLQRVIILPLILLTLILITVRSDRVVLGIGVAVVTAALLGGYPSWAAVAVLGLVYGAAAVLVRSVARRLLAGKEAE